VPPRNWEVRVHDILDAIEKIGKYTSGMTIDQFTVDDKTMDAVLMNFSIIGEAANAIPDDIQVANPVIPWSEIIGMRNIVIHGYFRVSVSVVWTSLKEDLPNLVPLLKALLPNPTGVPRS
jgi:uncharacterized protein with HEPN domain